MLNHNLVLKSDEVFLVGDIATDGSGEQATGSYLRDTRHLSRFALTLNGSRPEGLSVQVQDPTHAAVMLTNDLLRLPDGGMVLPHTVAVEQRISLGTELNVGFSGQNFGRVRLSLALTFALAADFRDMFDIRGFHRDAHGRRRRPRIEEDEIILGYEGLDGVVVKTALHFN